MLGIHSLVWFAEVSLVLTNNVFTLTNILLFFGGIYDVVVI